MDNRRQRYVTSLSCRLVLFCLLHFERAQRLLNEYVHNKQKKKLKKKDLLHWNWRETRCAGVAVSYSRGLVRWFLFFLWRCSFKQTLRVVCGYRGIVSDSVCVCVYGTHDSCVPYLVFRYTVHLRQQIRNVDGMCGYSIPASIHVEKVYPNLQLSCLYICDILEILRFVYLTRSIWTLLGSYQNHTNY